MKIIHYLNLKGIYCRLGGYNDAEILGYKNLDELRSLVDQIMLRRLKTEVLDLPDKIEKLEYVEIQVSSQTIFRNSTKY